MAARLSSAFFIGLVICLIAGWPPPTLAGQGATMFPTIFASSDVFSPDLAPFRRWTEVLERSRREVEAVKPACQPDIVIECAPTEWDSALQELSGLDLRSMVERVNARINAHPYVPATENWGVADYWETPFEFLRRNGQCQDYAIAKFLLLRAAGVPNDLMRVVIVHDAVQQQDHAVLVVDVDGEGLLLDNQSVSVVSAADGSRYFPYYSINESGWWRHLAKTVTASQS